MGVNPSPGHRFPVVIATLTPQPYFDRCVQSVFNQTPVPADLLLIQQSEAVRAQVDQWQDHATIYRPGRNIGLSKAMNYGLRWAFDRGYSEALLMNDDMVLTDPRTLTLLLDIIKVAPRQLRWIKNRGYSAIVVTRAITEEIGWFDEDIAFAYFEDNDHHRRVILAGIPWDDVQIDSEHMGSGSIKSDSRLNQLNGITFPINQQWYLAKWGGGPGQETYTVPWNGAEPWSAYERVPGDVRAEMERAYDLVPA